MIRIFFYLFLIPLSGALAFETSTKSLYEDIKNDIIKDHSEERKLTLSIYIIDRQIKDMSSEISQATNLVFKTQAQSQDLAQKIIQLEEKVKFDQKKLVKRLHFIYGLKDQHFLKALFSSMNVEDLSKNIFLLRKISQRDIKAIRKLKEDLKSLNKSKDQLKKKVANFISLKRSLKEKKGSLDDIQRQKNSLISQIKKARKTKLLEIENLKETLQKEHIEVAASFFERKGKMKYPVSYKSIIPYKVIRDPKHGYRLTHKGHFYESPKGSSVYNVHPGKVAYSGVMEGYGKTVIIDHGDHYYTVYSGHDVVYVTENQELTKRVALGSVGFSKRHQTTGTYFEIRHFSDAIDPQPWIKLNKKSIERSP